MEGVTGMMARLSHMPRVAAGGSAMYRTRVFFSEKYGVCAEIEIESSSEKNFAIIVVHDCNYTCPARMTDSTADRSEVRCAVDLG